ncbi:MAG: PKD domain-containing protein, partial [Candidatus Diapherotrites archaeon]
YTDPEGNPEGTSTYRWAKNGTWQTGQTTKTLNANNTTTGDNWKCEVTPGAQTGTSPGAPAESVQVTINANPQPPPASCRFIGANPQSIMKGENASAVITHSNFSTPPNSYGSIICGDGATGGTIDCNATNCTIHCGAYTSSGTYPLSNLSGLSNGTQTAASCLDSGSFSVTVNDPENQNPTATLSATPASGTTPLNVAFAATCNDPDGTITSCSINFGDGNTTALSTIETTQTIHHTYTNSTGAPVTRNATLTATDDRAAQVSSIPATITVNPVGIVPPTAALNASPSSGTAPLNVSFTATCNDSDGTISSCSLNFGDGNTTALSTIETTQTIHHTYTNSTGSTLSRTATLTATDNQGLTALYTAGISLVVQSNQPPTASAGPDKSVLKGTPAALFGLGADPEGYNVSYRWSLSSGTGNASDCTSSGVTSASYILNCTTSGTRIATLTVTDILGETASDSAVITFTDTTPPPQSNTAPTLSGLPDKSMNRDSSPPANWIDLHAYANDAQDTDAQLAFSVQSQSNSTLVNCYISGNRYLDCGISGAGKTGSNDVKIRVTDSGGLFAEDTLKITVTDSAPPPENLAPTANAGGAKSANVNEQVSLNGSGSDPEGGALSYQWRLSSGTGAANDCTASGTYSQQYTLKCSTKGTRTATLTVKDSGGLPDSDSAVITVKEVQPEGEIVSVSFSSYKLRKNSDENITVVVKLSSEFGTRLVMLMEGEPVFTVSQPTRSYASPPNYVSEFTVSASDLNLLAGTGTYELRVESASNSQSFKSDYLEVYDSGGALPLEMVLLAVLCIALLVAAYFISRKVLGKKGVKLPTEKDIPIVKKEEEKEQFVKGEYPAMKKGKALEDELPEPKAKKGKAAGKKQKEEKDKGKGIIDDLLEEEEEEAKKEGPKGEGKGEELEEMGVGLETGLGFGKEEEEEKDLCPRCWSTPVNVIYCPECGEGFCEKCAKKAEIVPGKVKYFCPKCGKTVNIENE